MRRRRRPADERPRWYDFDAIMQMRLFCIGIVIWGIWHLFIR